jgi:multiple sugar transport system ATP-binding protein
MTEPMAQAQIKLQKVAKRFGSFTAVEPLDLEIQRGEFVVLLGPSGCGKTTTLRMIAGLESPTEGTITVADRDVTRLPPGDRDIAFVFQLFALYPHLNAFDNIAFPLRATGLSRDEVRNRVEAVAKRLSLGSLLKRKPATLSGGDQQRVSLARAMVRQPAAFLMDEPLGTLDADRREHTRAEIRAIHNELNAAAASGNGHGSTTVFVTHDQLEAMSLADRIAVMKDGKLLQYAGPQEVYDHPADLFVAHFIGSPGMNFLKTQPAADAMQKIEGADLLLPAPRGAGNLTLGIRPEYVHLAGDMPGSAHVFEAPVEHTERLGSYNMLTLTLGGAIVKARVPAGRGALGADGGRAKIAFDPAGLRWFDPQTQRAIKNGAA